MSEIWTAREEARATLTFGAVVAGGDGAEVGLDGVAEALGSREVVAGSDEAEAGLDGAAVALGSGALGLLFTAGTGTGAGVGVVTCLPFSGLVEDFLDENRPENIDFFLTAGVPEGAGVGGRVEFTMMIFFNASERDSPKEVEIKRPSYSLNAEKIDV